MLGGLGSSKGFILLIHMLSEKNLYPLSLMKDLKSKRKDTEPECSPWVACDTAQKKTAEAGRTSVPSDRVLPGSRVEFSTYGVSLCVWGKKGNTYQYLF